MREPYPLKPQGPGDALEHRLSTHLLLFFSTLKSIMMNRRGFFAFGLLAGVFNFNFPKRRRVLPTRFLTFELFIEIDEIQTPVSDVKITTTPKRMSLQGELISTTAGKSTGGLVRIHNGQDSQEVRFCFDTTSRWQAGDILLVTAHIDLP